MTRNTLFISLALILTGCAPKVVTDTFTQGYAPVPPDSVHLFVSGQPTPPHTMAIGTVKVVDNGFSIKGSLERVMNMAVEATAKNGGNGLVITEHRSPDGKSTIHRVWGTMLRIPDDAAASLPVKTVEQLITFADDSVKHAEYLKYQQQVEEYNREIDEIQKIQPRNIFRVSAGSSFMVSKMVTPERTYKTRTGFDLTLDYDHLWKTGFGFGVNYLYNATSFEGGYDTDIHYIGPSFVMAAASTKWRIGMAYGLGYAHYSESLGNMSESENRLALFIRLDAEYRLAKRMALGINLHYMSMSMKKPKEIELKKGEFYGIRHLSPHLSLCYYI